MLYVWDQDNDKLREECGVFGIWGHDEAATITALALHSLQHRGQEAAGIVSYDTGHFHSERRFGLVSDNFTNKKVMDRLPGESAIGHVRYSTTGESAIRNIQPLYADLSLGGFAVAHNGNFTNALKLREQLVFDGAIFQSTSDTEAVLQLTAKSKKNGTVARFADALSFVDGAYALVALSDDNLLGARDPFGIRPLIIGKLGDSFVLASETCALDIIGAEFLREVENGELVVISDAGLKSYRASNRLPERRCIFEYIYFARPDSVIDGLSVYECRKEFGRRLALESHVPSDIVIPVPDSGVPAALGYAEHAGLNFELGIIRNHYVGRTFIEPQQSSRAFGVKLKHNINREVVKGKRVVLVDDSIVRGTTSVKIVELMRQAGATEIHMRIASPPIKFPDFYGIDTPQSEQLLASTKSLAEIKKFIGVDSLEFLSLDGLYVAMGHSQGRDPLNPAFTDHCFSGDYPTALIDQGIEWPSEPSQLATIEAN